MRRFEIKALFALIAVFPVSVPRVDAQQSNVTVPVPGDVIPDDESGRPALFFDARSTGFTRDGKQQVFDGDVIAIGSRSIVTADKVIVDQQNHRLIADGHVVILAADQILIGDKIEYLLDTGDFKINGAKMIVNDKKEAERISKEVLGFSPQELSFETHRKTRLDEISKNKDDLRQSVRGKVKTGQDASPQDIRDYARYLEQEDLVKGQENPAFAHMTEARRNTLRKRRDFWEQSKIADKVSSDPGRQLYFRLEGDELTRVNGNDFNAKHSLWTPCHCENDEAPAWGVRAATTEAQMGGYATFYDAMLEIKGMPILYLPWLKLPIKDRRQSGLLMPTFSDDAVSGSGFSQPLYLDLGPDRDATFKGDVFERRGMRAGAEYRWKRRQYSGLQLNIEGMRDRIWLRQRANRRDLMGMYRDGLAAARQTPAGTAESDLAGYTGREYTRQRLAQRSWWEANANECLSPDAAVRQACEDVLSNTTRAPKNANRGLAKWKVYDRFGERSSFVTSGELYSDRQYNADVYLPEAMQPGFDSGSGERGINPARSRMTYDGTDYFLGLGSYWGDPSRLDDRFEGYQLPAQVRAASRWYTVKQSGVPVYARVATDYSRVLRDPGTPEDTEFRKSWLPGGSWRRGEISLISPLTERTAVQVDHFTDLEGRTMSFDGRMPDASRTRESSLMSWKTGFRFQLPIDGRSRLPDWLGGFSNENGQRMIQHIMNWSMTLTTRPMVRRRGPYGQDQSSFAGSPRTWFATDRAGGDDNISATEFMNEYQIVSFGTSHRWKLFNEAWTNIPGAENPAKATQEKTLTYEEKARRDLLYTMDHPVKSAADIFSSDQKQWFGDRYQLLETDYTEPVTFSAGISYDRLKDVRRAKEGKTRDNRPWSETDSSLGLNVSGWSLSTSSKYNIYDKTQTKLASSFVPPSAFDSNLSMGYTIEKSPYTTSSGGLGYVVTREKTLTLVTSLTAPVTSSWSYSVKEKENEAPNRDYRQKLNLIYGSSSGCWGLGFAREKGYGVDERGASYLLQFNMTFMGQTRDLPNMSSSLERELKKS